MCLFARVSVSMCVCQFAWLCACLCAFVLFGCSPEYVIAYLTDCLPLCLSVCLSVCLYV